MKDPTDPFWVAPFFCILQYAPSLSMYACRITPRGVEYSGTLNQTLSGLECQRWDSMHPHSHSHTEPFRFAENSLSSAENFCRNPSNEESGPWCFTTDTSVEKEKCNVPFCAPYRAPCQTSSMGQEYAGTVNSTREGRICQRWDSGSPHWHRQHRNVENFPDVVESLSEAENFCRNPDREPEGPWCYTMDDNTRWEYCDIPFCSDGLKISEIYINQELQTDLTLVDGNLSTCDTVDSDNFRLKLLTATPWMQLTVEFAFNSNTLTDCSSSPFLAYFSASQDACGPVTPCQWQSVHSTIDKNFCRFTCISDTLCQSMTLHHHLLPTGFQLCEVTLLKTIAST